MTFKGVRLKRSGVKGRRPNPLTDLQPGDLLLNIHPQSGALFARAADDSLLEWPAGSHSGSSGGAGVVVAATPPTDPANGLLWWHTGERKLRVWYDSDGIGTADPGAWLEVVSAAAVGDATATTKGVVQLADSTAITAGTAGRVIDAAQLKAAAAPEATATVKGLVQLADAAAAVAGTAGRVVDAAQLKAVSDRIGAGGVTTVTAAAPITSSGGATPQIGITAATQTESGSMSAADKAKLDGIKAGAEPNVQPDWAEADAASAAFIRNKPLVPLPPLDATTVVKGIVQLADGAAISAGTAGRVVDAAQLKAVRDQITTGGFLTGVSGQAPITSSGGTTPVIGIAAATTAAAGSMSAADKTKLDGIAAGARVNVQANWTETNATSDAFIRNKPGNATTTVAGLAQLADAAALTAGMASRVITADLLKAELDKRLLLTGGALTGPLTSNSTISDSKGNLRDIPQVATTGKTLDATDAGKHVAATGTITLPGGVFTAGQAITIYNNTAGDITLSINATAYMAGDNSPKGFMTLATRGICTILCVASNTFVISGAGLS